MKIYRISQVEDENGKKKEIRGLISEVPPREKPRVYVTMEEIADEICKITEGKVVSIDDLIDHLERRHKNETIVYERDYWPLMRNGEWVPYWRVVSPKGFIGQVGFARRKEAEYFLEKEGVLLKPASRSLKVADLERFRFQFDRGKTAC